MQRSWLWLAASPMLLLLSVPLLALVLRTPPAVLLSTLFQPDVAQAIALSMTTTLATVAIALVAGTPVGYLLSRRQFRGKALIDTLIDLPLILPPAVAGIASAGCLWTPRSCG